MKAEEKGGIKEESRKALSERGGIQRLGEYQKI
jgi:hypothetical protein